MEETLNFTPVGFFFMWIGLVITVILTINQNKTSMTEQFKGDVLSGLKQVLLCRFSIRAETLPPVGPSLTLLNVKYNYFKATL